MAKTTSKQPVEPITENKPDFTESVDAALSIAPDIEDMIADQLLDSVDWVKVKDALIRKAPKKLFAWLQAQLLPTDGDRIICTEVEAMALSEGKNDA
ncbi:MAG: hypothetical protein IM597_12435 [Pseudanabaena sp. M176S2SP2A07QC]|nr:hypothetical protein [Pseudanabaena sp. M176S2SP2A07QC]MCA6547803.1 hypothetical protein [Pseudanabaena sp. M152S2SP2A07QC]MCA6567072.1 hypothetical protein [Pseudanabaena sp. M151S2SP2A07QC]MCA6622021.1 hypothetical protein [Pseudanabaena sp. M165S2SP1A06QC]